MEEQTVRMVAHRVQVEQLDVEHVGKPGKRMPVTGMKGREGPDEPLQRQPLADYHVRGDIIGVVVIDEPIMQHRPVNRDSQYRYQEEGRRQLPLSYMISSEARLKFRRIRHQ